jgi:hypothetical protein
MRTLQKTVLLFVLLSCPAFAAQPRGFTFTKIADDAGPIESFRSGKLNELGMVAMTVTLDRGGFAVLVGDGRTLQKVAETSAGSFGEARINNRGDVVFRGDFLQGSGILISSQGRLSTLIEIPVIGEPAINTRGTVVFSVFLDTGARPIVALDHGVLTTVADRPADFLSFALVYDINERGQVLFLGDPSSPSRAVLTVKDGHRKWVAADASGAFEIFTGAAINELGTVAFSVFSGAQGQGVYVSDPRNGIRPVATSDGPFDLFLLGGLSLSGKPVFMATLDTGGSGVFVGPDPVADRVIGSGDILDGATVSRASALDVNSFGQILLAVSFEHGPTALYRTQYGSVH